MESGCAMVKRKTETHPKGRKSKRTRAALIAAARVVIGRDGFQNAKIADIASAAGKAVGVFYSYFPNKYEIFEAMINEFIETMANAKPDPLEFGGDAYAILEADVTAFWMASKEYRADMSGLLEVALVDARMMDVWRALRSRGISRFEKSIRRRREVGFCEVLDPSVAASALMGLIEFACFNWQAGKLDFPGSVINDRHAIETLVAIIASTLELKSGD